MSNHVIVTGAAGGIGSQLCRDLVDVGYRVTAIDRPGLWGEQPGHARAAEVELVEADVTDSEQVAQAVKTAVSAFGTPAGLVNLAGNNRLKPLTQTTDEDWIFLLHANLTSTFYMCREVIPLMANAGGGKVVNTSSIFGLRGNANDVAYSSAKAGVIGLTRALAVEYAPHNILVNNVAPVVTMTPRVAAMPPEHLDAQLERIPLGRFSKVSDVTSTYLFLLSDKADYFTGQTLSPNGGDLMP